MTQPDADIAELLASLTDSSLYSIGAFFCDQHPELVDDVLAEGLDIERRGLAAWAAAEEVDVPAAFQTLVTSLAIRYFTAVAGTAR